MKSQWYRRHGKRWLDLIVAMPLLLLIFPLLLLIGIGVRLDSPGPVLFAQERLGYRGQIFRAYKFRTMTHKTRIVHREIAGQNSEVTRLGYWLRRFKLDELPQLFNVVKGEMSIVGPRPALPEQLSEYDDVGQKRLLVCPGLTGLAQVNGNIHLSWPERWQWDAVYIENVSLWMDLEIILRTAPVLLFGERRFARRQ